MGRAAFDLCDEMRAISLGPRETTFAPRAFELERPRRLAWTQSTGNAFVKDSPRLLGMARPSRCTVRWLGGRQLSSPDVKMAGMRTGEPALRALQIVAIA